jgi:Tfp pilus assembly protein PilV
MLQHEAGLTLIEVLAATLVLAVGIAGTFGLINTSAKTSVQTHDREGAVSLAREILEDAHTIPFAQLTPSTVVEKLQEMSGLKNISSGSTWQIKQGSAEGLKGETRAGVTYTVTASECSIDSPKDGLAKTSELTTAEAETFCEKHKGNEEWVTGDEVDPAPVDFKRITVKVSWPGPGSSTRKPYVEQVTLLNAAGEPTGLSTTELKLVPPPTPYIGSSVTAPVITESTVKELTFSVNAPEGASALRWSLEGAAQSPAPTLKEGTIWTFKWKIEGLSDGTYEVSAQAITSTGVLGPPITIPVTLIRGEPAEPKGVKYGFNEVYVEGTKKRALELQWEANSERNVIGYRVKSPEGSVCPSGTGELSLSLSCIEVPRKYEPGSTPAYTVAALYSNAKKEIVEGKKKTVTLGKPEEPNVPTGLTVTKNEDGSVTLKWNAPKEGPAVAFYRIYRGSTNYTSRYATAPASETSYNDSDATVAHTYWVAAVSSTMTESSFVGPVSG